MAPNWKSRNAIARRRLRHHLHRHHRTQVAEARLRLADLVFANSPSGIVIADAQQRILAANPPSPPLPAWPPERRWPGRRWAAHSQRLPDLGTCEALDTRGAWHGRIGSPAPERRKFIASIRVARVDDKDNLQPSHHIWLLSDATERRRAEEQIRHMAQHDTLTGLPNRLALSCASPRCCPRRGGSDWKVAVMFLDLDRFKVISDTLGHQVGDELLREVASPPWPPRCGNRPGGAPGRRRVRRPAARLSPTPPTPPSSPARSSAPCRRRWWWTSTNSTTPSIGISIFPTDGSDGDTVLKNADTAMYHAKAAGRNNYQFYARDMNLATTARLGLEKAAPGHRQERA